MFLKIFFPLNYNHKDIDWMKLEKKEITQPYKPKIRFAGDVGNFDTMFTEMSINSTKRNVEVLANGTITMKNSKNTYKEKQHLPQKPKPALNFQTSIQKINTAHI